MRDVFLEIFGRISKVIKVTIPVVNMESEDYEMYNCDVHVYMIPLDGQAQVQIDGDLLIQVVPGRHDIELRTVWSLAHPAKAAGYIAKDWR